MALPFNIYNDKKVKTTGEHGANIAEQRQDELDQASLLFALETIKAYGQCNAADLGAGSGAHSKTLARLGAKVLMVDLSDQAAQITAHNSRIGRHPIRFVRADVRRLPDDVWPRPLHLLYTQRMLGFLPYGDALTLFRRLKSLCAPTARFFVSASGLDTEYGATYPARDLPVADRFANLAPDMAEKHDIRAKQCLYRTDELAALLQEAGLKILQAKTSPFGNPKLIAALP